MKKLIALVLVMTVIFASLVFASVSVSAANTADSLVAIAEGELGNTNYRKYSTYSNAWCADFVSWCARQAGVDSIPSTASCYSMYNGMIANGCNEVSSPQRGDIVFFFCNSCSGTANIWCHVGIMIDSSTSIDGNYSGKVSYDNNYSHYGSLGYKHSSGISKIYVRPNYESGHNPTGVLDIASGGDGTVYIRGWAFDEDDINAQLNIHVYIGGPSGDANAEGHNQTWANQNRVDVNNAYGCGDYHGYSDTIPTLKTGTQTIYVYAINVGDGSNIEIGHQTVYVTPDTEQPHGNTPWINCVTRDSFRVNIAPTDNVGIKKVSVATWTHNQDDLIWHDALYNGDGIYYLDVNRSDYSNTQNSFYNNHFYVYDYSGNYISVACNQDYKITSDTGKNIPEGEYRIATAVKNDKYLDVAGGSTTSGANIQIYSNSISPLQTYSITYSNNGFYKIANTHSNCLVDVDGDTYLNNTNVIQWTANGGPNQEWMFKPTGENDGYYYIIARSNGLALDVTDALDQDGANVAVHTQNQTTAQKWKLRRVLKNEMVNVDDVVIKSETDDIMPEISVTVDGEIIPRDGNYRIELTTDIASGKGTVTVTGLNNYCDVVTKEFAITVAPLILGDTDGDGEITISDVTMLQRFLAELSIPTTEEQMMCGDVDNSGELEVSDATAIQRYLADMTIPYEIGKVI